MAVGLLRGVSAGVAGPRLWQNSKPVAAQHRGLPLAAPSRHRATPRHALPTAAAAAPAAVAAPHQVAAAERQARLDDAATASLFALLTATGADAAAGPLPAQRRTLHRAERFDDVYEIGEVLGNGTYGVVRTATHRATGEQFAVKILQRRRNKADRTAIIENEAAMADRVRWCPSVARTHEVYTDTYSIYIVQELLVGDSLQALLDAQGALAEPEAAAALRGVLAALEACHAEGICYGDVKPSNFMLASLYPCVLHLADPSAPKGDLDVRMVDFGCAQACPDEYSLEGLSGTPVYMAPEVAAGQPYGPASDLWGAGVMLYQLLTGRFPYAWDSADALREVPMRQVLADVSAGAVTLDAAAAAGLSEGARALLAALLERDPERRVSAHAALRHAWLAEHGQGLGGEGAAGRQ